MDRFVESMCWISFAGVMGALDLYIPTTWAIITAAITIGFINLMILYGA